MIIGIVLIFLLQLNSCISFKCLSRKNMQLVFTCDREVISLSVGVTEGAEVPPDKDELVSSLHGCSDHIFKTFRLLRLHVYALNKVSYKHDELLNASPWLNEELNRSWLLWFASHCCI
jgi:hypothetical protein